MLAAMVDAGYLTESDLGSIPIRKAEEAARAREEQERFEQETSPYWWDQAIERIRRPHWFS